MPLTVGETAPDFTLPDTDRKQRSLKEFLGKKTVLAFFPGAFTGVCTKEMCTLRDSLAQMSSLQAQVVAISVDAPAANKAFAEINKLGFPVLSDYKREVSRKYVGVYEAFGGLQGLVTAKRSVLVLDPKGVIRYMWVTENSGDEPKYDEITRALSAI
jgi:peroxiredoxin